MKRVIKINNMMCENCLMHVKKALEEIGSTVIEVNLDKGEAIIDDNDIVSNEDIIEAVDEAGYDVESID